MKKINWDAIQERQDGEFISPAPGGYIAKITRVEDNEEREFLKIEWDFAEGEFKGSNAATFERAHFWPGSFVRSYKDSALGFFKGFKTTLETSNTGYHFSEDRLNDMIGRFIGLVIGEEEYRKNDGTVGTRMYVAQVRSGQAIRSGDYKTPELKKLAPDKQKQSYSQQYPTATIGSDEDLPF